MLFSSEELFALIGDKATALSILQSFISVHKDNEKEIKAHIAAGEYYEARQILHNLIGVSGNLFLRRLCEASKQLGADLRAERTDSLDDFCKTWEETIAEVSRYVTD